MYALVVEATDDSDIPLDRLLSHLVSIVNEPPVIFDIILQIEGNTSKLYSWTTTGSTDLAPCRPPSDLFTLSCREIRPEILHSVVPKTVSLSFLQLTLST